jgi:hypothetical protein
MAAKRVSVILGEILEHIAREGARPQEWRFELLATSELSSHLAILNTPTAREFILEAYSARDAHDVERALLEMGCTSTEQEEDATRNFIWMARTVTSENFAVNPSDPVSAPHRG